MIAMYDEGRLARRQAGWLAGPHVAGRITIVQERPGRKAEADDPIATAKKSPAETGLEFQVVSATGTQIHASRGSKRGWGAVAHTALTFRPSWPTG